MSAADDVDLAALDSVTRVLTASVSSIENGEWSSATPCTGWDLTALVEHITGGNWFTVEVLAGQRAKAAMTVAMERFEGRHTASEAAVQSLRNQVVAFRRPGTLDGTWNHILGDISGRLILRLRLHDLIVHSWDLAEARRPGATLPDDLLRWGLAEVRHDDSVAVQHFDLVAMPTRRLTSDDDVTCYLGMFGRSPGTGRAPAG